MGLSVVSRSLTSVPGPGGLLCRSQSTMGSQTESGRQLFGIFLQVRLWLACCSSTRGNDPYIKPILSCVYRSWRELCSCSSLPSRAQGCSATPGLRGLCTSSLSCWYACRYCDEHRTQRCPGCRVSDLVLTASTILVLCSATSSPRGPR